MTVITHTAQVASRRSSSGNLPRRTRQALAEQRLLERSQGGAISHGSACELPVRYRSGQAPGEKQHIAREALTRVCDGDVVALTGGTTTTAVGHQLARRSRLSVVTNALNVAAELSIRSDIKLIVTGGVARSASYELVGPLAEATLSQINIDIAFVGVDGIEKDAGLTTANETEAATNRTLIERSLWVPITLSLHAAWEYSWMRPPSRSRRRMRVLSSGVAFGSSRRVVAG